MDADRIRRTVAEVTGLLRERELRFRDLGIESMNDFRQRKARLATLAPQETAGDPLSQDQFGDVVLVVDGWATIRSDFEMLEPALQAIAIGGLSYGIHLAITASRWMEIRPAVKDMLGEIDLLLVIGSRNSSNSNRLVDVARASGVPAHLIDDEAEIDSAWLDGIETVGITSGASAPERLVTRVCDWFRARGVERIESHRMVDEDVTFRLPVELRRELQLAESRPG